MQATQRRRRQTAPTFLVYVLSEPYILFQTHSMASEVKAALKGAREALEKKDYPTGM